MTCSKCIHQKVKLSMLSIILYLHFPPFLKTGDICPILVLQAPRLPSLSFPEEAPAPPLSQSSPLSGTCFLLPLYSSAIPPVLTVSNQAQQASLLQPFPMPSNALQERRVAFWGALRLRISQSLAEVLSKENDTTQEKIKVPPVMLLKQTRNIMVHTKCALLVFELAFI